MKEQYPEYSKGILFAIGTALSWAVLAILLKYSLSFADSASIVWVRMTVAGLLFSLLVIKKDKQQWRYLFKAPLIVYLAALSLAFNFFGYMKCIDLTTASNAQIMIQIGPLLLAITGILYFKETPNKIQLIGFLLATMGFAFFYRDQLLISWESKDKYISGNIWIVAAAFTWAFFTVVQKHMAQKLSPQKVLYVIFIIASLCLAPLANFNTLYQLDFLQWLLIILLGANSWLAYAFLGEALKRAPASHVSLIITLNPLLTIFTIQSLDHWQLLFIPSEAMNAMSYLGAGLVVIGVAMTIVSHRKV